MKHRKANYFVKNKEASRSTLGRRSTIKNYGVSVTVAVLVIVSGLWVIDDAGRDCDRLMRRDLMNRTADLAATINPNSLRTLSFTVRDNVEPEFQQICSQIRNYAGIAEMKSLYTLAIRDGKLIVGSKDFPAGNPYASSPDTVYRDPVPSRFELDDTLQPKVVGPIQGEQGTFISASAPVFDPLTGEVLAVAGIDVDASDWNRAVREAQRIPCVLVLGWFFVLLLTETGLRWYKRNSPNHQHQQMKRYTEPFSCGLFLLFLTCIVAFTLDRNERVKRRDSFHQLARAYVVEGVQKFYGLRSQLDQLVFFYESSQEVDRKEFKTYFNYLITESVADVVFWLPSVSETDVAALVQNAQGSGLSGFSIWERDAQGHRQPVPPRPFYYPSLYMESRTSEEALLGYDFYSEPVVRETIDTVRRTGLSSATPPTPLLAISGAPLGIYIFKPVEAPVQKGLIVFAVRLDQLLGRSKACNNQNFGFDVCLFELRSDAPPLFMSATSASACLELYSHALDLSLSLPIFRFGKVYLITFSSDEAWIAMYPLRAGLLAALVGLLIAALVSTMVGMVTNRRIKLERLVEQRTAELHANQEKLLEAQKMESVGRLAGGVAHDFNNMLQVILGTAEMALERVSPSEPLYDDLAGIHQAAQRSAALTKQLLAFARKQAIKPRIIDLNVAIEELRNMLKHLAGEDVELVFQPSPELWNVKIDASQVDQILTNLCVNARDAIVSIGKIIIETHNFSCTEDYVLGHAGFLFGDYVVMSLSDNGCGIDSETLPHLFEPFFTTKEFGKGTGLGLATVYGIVKQNGGFVHVHSEPSKGATFSIYIPRETAQCTEATEEYVPKVVVGHGETLLLVEDETVLLGMTRRMLSSLGYDVFSTSSPTEALRLAEVNQGKIHLLLTDLVMPEMTGRNLANQISLLCPGIKMLFMSGYTAQVIAHHGILEEGVNFIQKPFPMKGLAAKLREILDAE